MLFVYLLTVAIAANAAAVYGSEDVKIDMEAFGAAFRHRMSHDHMSATRELLIGQLLPAEFAGSKVTELEAEPLTVVGRFLKAIIPDESKKGILKFKFFAPGQSKCDEAFTTEMGFGIGTCFKVRQPNGTKSSVMLTAENAQNKKGRDMVATTVMMFADARCKVPLEMAMEQNAYLNHCRKSPVEFPGIQASGWMKVEYSRSNKLKMDKVESFHAVAISHTPTMGKCAKDRLVDYAAHNTDCGKVTLPLNGVMQSLDVKGFCANGVAMAQAYLDPGCMVPMMGMTFPVNPIGCFKDIGETLFDEIEPFNIGLPLDSFGPIDHKFTAGFCK